MSELEAGTVSESLPGSNSIPSATPSRGFARMQFSRAVSVVVMAIVAGWLARLTATRTRDSFAAGEQPCSSAAPRT